MAVVLKVSSVDRSASVVWSSLRIENILTKQVDRCTFTMRSYGTKVYRPPIGREVIVEDAGTRVFGGVIVRVTEQLKNYPMVEYDVECSDYTRVLDQHLVAEIYENMTVNAIIADLLASWAPAGFTATQVDCPAIVKYIQFKYEPVSHCLEQLADIVGYDWYVDYSKDLYFKSPTASAAPVSATDSNGVVVAGSLTIRRDSSQLRNSIIVRGGEYLGAEFTFSEVADGKKIAYELPYKFTDFKVRVGGVVKTVGVDNLSDPASYDVLYNFNEKIARFREDNKPAANATLSFAGKPYLPVIVKYKDQGLVDAIFSAEAQGDGKYEYLVLDKSINSKEGARQRALAEIQSYGETLSEGNFDTEQSGLLAGQRILIDSAALGISEYFIINRVVAQMKDLTTMVYRVSLVTTKTFDFISTIKKLLLADTKKIEVDENEVLDLVEGSMEEITIADVVASSQAHNPQAETITLGESFANNGLDFGTTFVLGPYVPSTVYRVFCLGGSRMS